MMEVYLQNQTPITDYLSDGQGNYHQNVVGFSNVAVDMGVKIAPADLQLWEAMAYTCRFLDTCVDELGSDRQQLLSSMSLLIAGEPPEGYDVVRARNFSRIYLQLTQGHQDAFLNDVSTFATITARTKESSNATELLLRKRQEALLFSRFFELIDRREGDIMERIHFNEFMRHFSVAGYYIDAALDLPRDASSGQLLRLQSSNPLRFRLLSAGIFEITKARHIWSLLSIRELSSIALRNATRAEQ